MTNILGGEINDACMIQLECFVVLMYDRTSECLEGNEARKQLFIQKSRTLETIPPTKAALEQHIKRASYQARCWSQALVKNSQLPSPSHWGWIKKEGEWHPIWTTLGETAKSYHELICCKCKQGCICRCKCVKAGLKCTALLRLPYLEKQKSGQWMATLHETKYMAFSSIFLTKSGRSNSALDLIFEGEDQLRKERKRKKKKGHHLCTCIFGVIFGPKMS